MRPDEKRRAYDAIQGMINALVALPETTEAFEQWDARLGVSAKARRLAHATELAARDGSDPTVGSDYTDAHRVAEREATETFESATAGRDLRDSGLLAEAAALLRGLGYRGPVDLSFHLLARFVQVKAAEGGYPLPDAPDPDFSAGWGYAVKIQSALPPDDVLVRLKELERIARVAKKAVIRRGRPAERDAAKWRRAGRWYVLNHIGRARDDLARMRHRELGTEHAKATWSEAIGTCESCQRTVGRDLEAVRKLLEVVKD